MESNRIVVTGAAGFIGSSLCEALVEQGHSVLGLDSLFRGSLDNLSAVLEHPHFQFMQGDVRDIDQLDDAVEHLGGVDIIYHLAAINGTKWFHEAAHSVIDVNINGTLRTLELAMANDARYVLASSPEAFGDAEIQPLTNGNPMTFSDPAEHQRHSYGASKYLDEVACQHASREGLDVRIVRPFNAYGPRLKGDEYGQVVAMFFQSIVNNQPLSLHAGGQQTRSFTWIGDIVDGFLKAGLMDTGLDGVSLNGCALNIGSTEEVSIQELQTAIYEVVASDLTWKQALPEVQVTDGYFGDSKRRLPNCYESTSLLGWSASTTLNDGLQRMWDSIR
ncbi:MAG: hypothetical protein CMA63_00590 [Euryarchaeota archaeon]|nr:hypothetical protein [Euryarchaeota archaeon]|tara:strand:+ start:817 stop:1815 length:999 start_codon:yes stop_codon:yes gene_type:complete